MQELLSPDVERPARICIARILRKNGLTDVDDVLQNARVQALRNVENFDGRSSYKTWFWRIAANEALMFLRRPHVKRALTGALSSIDEMWEDDTAYHLKDTLEYEGPSPEEVLLQKERSAVLWSAISELSPKLQKSVRVYLDPERKEPITRKDKMNMFRAKAQLRQILKGVQI